MSLRVSAFRTIPTRASPYSAHRLDLYNTRQSQLRFNPAARFSSRANQSSRFKHHSAHLNPKQSSTSFFGVVIVVGVGITGALLYPFATRARGKSQDEEKSLQKFNFADLTDSYLVMPPSMPPGRPGTLTPEQEVKLRELWQQTLRVFGVYEPLSPEPNGTVPPVETEKESTDANAKKEKKSRSRFFRRDKSKKEDGSESTVTSPTTGDISQLSIADEDDKHGLNKDFKIALANSTPEELRNAFWSMVKHDHPDALLLRFLRARKWDVDKALIMLISTMHWRAEEMHVDDDIIKRGELAALQDSKSDDPKVRKEGEDFIAQLRMGKSFLHGVDKEGRPMCIVRVRLHRQGEQSEQSLERFTVYLIETARMVLRPPVDTATVVFDMTNFSLANMDYTPVKFMIKCFEANYPESLGAVLVHKSPWIFQSIWTIIRGWLDPVVAGKVHFTKNAEELSGFIPMSQIPKELGGEEEWSYTFTEPDVNENAPQADTASLNQLQEARTGLIKKYESTILEWIHAETKQGTEKSKSIDERREERNAIAEELRKNYWASDPHLRARTLYDRNGVIEKDGALNFYPKANKEKENQPPSASQASAPSAVETSPDDLD